MIVSDVLAGKGSAVVTIGSEATVTDLVQLLAEHRIGAAVVCDDAGGLVGIVSERDVARGLYRHGADVTGLRVADLMTTDVRTCRPGDEIGTIAASMTAGRFRHLPVVVDGSIIGIVSIGDIVKKRIDELEAETDFLRDYVTSG